MIEIKTEPLSYSQRNARDSKRLRRLVILFISILLLITSSGLYLLFRSDRVHEFKTELSSTRIRRGNNYQEFEEIMKTRNTMSRMLFSFKPLKADKWFTPEEIEKFGFKTN